MASRREEVRRRRTALFAALVALAAAAAAVVVLLSRDGGHAGVAGQPAAGAPIPAPPRDPVRLGHIPPARPGVARVIHSGPSRREIALTFDDGFCKACVARTISGLAKAGAHATIFPNGRYAMSWGAEAATIRRLVVKGQLLIGNHTFRHGDAVAESAATFEADLLADERWIERTFGVTARPFFRPPYGAYNASTLAVAGRNGYTRVVNWSGTVADSSPRTVGYILAAIRHWARPGAIILMHANYPATSIALPQILAILRDRGLRPVTLKELLG